MLITSSVRIWFGQIGRQLSGLLLILSSRLRNLLRGFHQEYITFVTAMLRFPVPNTTESRPDRMIVGAEYYCLVDPSRLDVLAR